ncbi:MAG: hypothetical protein US43_C0016G0007 [Candidatus Levybacteria bacterium GW2011_GWA1_37_16]|nr:MAG: hypothetical protein US43_C0016G0007 [Candidatus Levybacteria bacterium GW2011_GWA1_37_16]KKQ42483.1 MAG: hypothetical protein US59_C0008G0002 [Candidatus Levybacteria bacterium GW2011_GWB1_37_8]
MVIDTAWINGIPCSPKDWIESSGKIAESLVARISHEDLKKIRST